MHGNCKNCDEKLESSWSFCPTCGITTAAIKKLVRSQKGESEESKKRRQTPSMREMALDVVARQALSGANWQLLCKDVMEMYEISVSDVKKELYDRGYKVKPTGEIEKFQELSTLKGVEEKNIVSFPHNKEAPEKLPKPGKLPDGEDFDWNEFPGDLAQEEEDKQAEELAQAFTKLAAGDTKLLVHTARTIAQKFTGKRKKLPAAIEKLSRLVQELEKIETK